MSKEENSVHKGWDFSSSTVIFLPSNPSHLLLFVVGPCKLKQLRPGVHLGSEAQDPWGLCASIALQYCTCPVMGLRPSSLLQTLPEKSLPKPRALVFITTPTLCLPLNSSPISRLLCPISSWTSYLYVYHSHLKFTGASQNDYLFLKPLFWTS